MSVARTCAVASIPAILAIAAHARGIPAALRGELYFGRPLGASDALYAHRFARETLDRVSEAWETQDLLGFACRGVWDAGVQSGALNLLDFALLVWPARLLPIPAAFLALHLGLVVLAALSGAAFAQAIGAGPHGRVAAGLVAGGSGLVLHHAGVGQYPQALVAAPLLFFAGLARGSVPMLAVGIVASTLLYWQNVLILGLGGAVFVLVARPPLRPLAAALVVSAVVLLPPGLVLLDALRSTPDAGAFRMEPWGTPFPDPVDGRDATMHVIDEVRWGELFGPGRAWALPALPLVVAFAWLRRDALPWVVLAVLGLSLAVGPWPETPWGGGYLDGVEGGPRARNPLYAAVYQWIPTASRMRHPNRWAILLLVGLCALVALGLHRLAERRPRTATLLVAAAAAWVAGVGPWPLGMSAFPGDLARAADTCTEIWATRAERPEQGCLYAPLDGLLWKPRYPATDCRFRGLTRPTDAWRRASDERMKRLAALLTGRGEPLEPGVCVFVDMADGADEAAILERAIGAPEMIQVPGQSVFPDSLPHLLAVFRAR